MINYGCGIGVLGSISDIFYYCSNADNDGLLVETIIFITAEIPILWTSQTIDLTNIPLSLGMDFLSNEHQHQMK